MFSGWLAVRSSTSAQSLPTLSTPFLVSVLILAILLGFSGLAQSAAVALEWDPVSDPRVAMYEVHWGVSSGQYGGSVISEANTAEITGLEEGETYFFVAKACTEGRATCSPPSEEVSTTLPVAKPRASFSVASSSGVAPHVVAFADTSSGEIESCAWDFGDGTTSTAPAPTHTYTSPGSYTVRLTVDGPGGSATATMTDVVSVTAAAPVADFDASKTAGEAPLTVTFTDASSGDVNTREWNLGGNTTTGATAVHTFTTAGTYTVSLTVSGPGGTATETKEDLVTVVSPRPVVADFNTSESVGPAPLTVRFMDASSGPVTGYHWDFGDGGTSTEPNPNHSYSVPGQYDVTLTVSASGGSDRLTKTNHVVVIGDELEIEVGEIVLDHKWKRVDFGRSFVEPVVIIKPIGGNGGNAAVVRLERLDSDGFWVRVQEWDYLDGTHIEETVSYMVIERGRHQLPDGAWIEAGQIVVSSDDGFVTNTFEKPFASTPVILATVTTNNEADAVTTRLLNIDEYGFELGLQEQEANPQEHAPETIAYIAWEPSSGEIEGMSYEVGRTADKVDHDPHTIAYASVFNLPPVFLADMQTTDGPDTSNLRWRDNNTTSVDIWVHEEQSRDSETSHTTEIVGYIAFGSANALVIEAGEIDVDDQWQHVDLGQSFSDPIVIAKSLSAYGDDPAVVRVDAVDRNGFWIRLQEWDYLGGVHVPETVSYVVIERGRHQLPSGAWIEANRIETQATHTFVNATFASPFATTPVVLTTVTTDNEQDAITTRVRQLDKHGFQVGLREQEANPQAHAFETITYLAWEPSVTEIDGLHVEVGRTNDVVTSSPHTLDYSTVTSLPPLFIADMQTTDGGDTANLRWDNKGPASVDVWVDEEQSQNAEVSHTTEVVGYLIIDDLLSVEND